MASIVDPSRARDEGEPAHPRPEEDPSAATLGLLGEWRARLVSHRAWHSDWEEVANVDRAIATITSLQDETRGLRRALASRATIDQAKGMIMAERRCDAEAAFQVLTTMSQDTNVPLRDVARALVYQAVRD